MPALVESFDERRREFLIIDTFTREAFNGTRCECLRPNLWILSRTEIDDAGKAFAADERVEPLTARAALDSVIEQCRIERCGGECRVKPSRVPGRMDAAFRVRPDDRDVVLERTREAGLIGNDQNAGWFMAWLCERALGIELRGRHGR